MCLQCWISMLYGVARKAQGGQWKHVYIDMGGIAPEAMNEDFYRWLYTAVTRATQKVFFINPTLEVM